MSGARGPRQPATRVHVDQTDKSGANRVREHLPDEAEELLKGRVQVINVWRPIRGPLRDAPLAMADGQTVEPGDLVASDLIYPNRSGETYSVKYNPNHRWYYIPEMRADEALLLKCYDSATDGRTRFGPHTAFIDPTTPADAAPRESIELRTLVFHKKLTGHRAGFAFPPLMVLPRPSTILGRDGSWTARPMARIPTSAR